MEPQKPDLRLEIRPAVRARSPRELLIFSLDDTLVDTSLYWLARAAFSRVVASKTGKTEGQIVSAYEAWGAENKRIREVSPGHEPVTMQDTWQAFQKVCDMPQDSGTDFYLLMTSALRSKFPVTIPGAEDLLKWAQPHFTLALLASGDSGIETQKLEGAKIAGFFKKIKIVASKGTEDFRALMLEMGFSPRNSWVIGSSMRSDINPAIASGANCIHYTYPGPKPVGSKEQDEEAAGPVFRIHELPDARAILAKPGFT